MFHRILTKDPSWRSHHLNSQTFSVKTLKIAWLNLNAICEIVVFTQCSRWWLFCDNQNIVHLVAYTYFSYKQWRNIKESISLKYRQVFLVPDRQVSPRQRLHRHPSFENTCVKCPGISPGYANAQPPGCDKIANAPPPGLTTWANAPRLPWGGGDGYRWDWLMHKPRTRVVCLCFHWVFTNFPLIW